MQDIAKLGSIYELIHRNNEIFFCLIGLDSNINFKNALRWTEIPFNARHRVRISV